MFPIDRHDENMAAISPKLYKNQKASTKSLGYSPSFYDIPIQSWMFAEQQFKFEQFGSANPIQPFWYHGSFRCLLSRKGNYENYSINIDCNNTN